MVVEPGDSRALSANMADATSSDVTDVAGSSTQPDPLAGFRPDHAGISVADLEASIAWYERMLGFKLDRIVNVPGDIGRVALIRQGDFIVELFCMPDAAPLPQERRHPATDLRTHGIKHVAYAVSDIHALMIDLKAKGVDVVWDVEPHDGTLCAFVRDNSGNLVEIVER